MDNRDFSLSRPVTSVPAPPAVSPSAPGAYPSHAEENPFGEPAADHGRGGGLRGRIGSILVAAGALFVKFFGAIKGGLVLLPKLFATAGTALVSIAAYSLFWGWTFALGFVVLLFVHEMGHVLQLRREGIKASAPMFIPFMGAAIFSKSLGDNALAEARVGLAGPILGSAGAAVCWAVGEATNSDLLRALAYVGFFLNLFNLLPVLPLDGGRAMAAMAPWMWFVGFGALVVLAFVFPNPIMLIIVLFGGMETWRRWKLRGTRSLEQAAYYRVSPRNRLIVGAVYIGLIVALVIGMHESHILTSAGHSFRSI
ncbi:MAG TPA: site-2 protease family protein [Solirubrobacteraceae bacterium]|nr:site-2 protease family protein [Solirubrobacteraceae bacterium]